MKPMAPWPKSKVTESPAFEHTGLDYFGALYIKQNKERKGRGGGCYVICNRNAANMDVVALYLSEQLNNNFILYTREINFSVHIYIFCPPFFFHTVRRNFVKRSHDKEEGKFSDSPIFHFDERSKSSQRILLVFGSLLLFFHRTSFTK